MSGTRERRARRDEVATPPSAPAGPAARRAARRALDPDVLVALEEERDHLLRSLRDLDAEAAAGDLDAEDEAALRDDYTARAAAVLRAIEEREAGLAAVHAARPPAGRRIAVTVAVLVFAVVAGWLMASAAGRRSGGDALTGDNRQTCRDLLLAASSQLGDQAAEAVRTYTTVLEQCPGNAEAYTYRGWLLYRTSLQAQGDDAQRLRARALADLDDAVTADPGYSDAHLFRAIAFKDLGRIDDARAELARIDPARVPPFMADRVASLQAQLATPGSTPGSTR